MQIAAAARTPESARSRTAPCSLPQSAGGESAVSAQIPARSPAPAPPSLRSAASAHASPENPSGVSLSFLAPFPFGFFVRPRLGQQCFNFLQLLRRRLPQRQHRLHQL